MRTPAASLAVLALSLAACDKGPSPAPPKPAATAPSDSPPPAPTPAPSPADGSIAIGNLRFPIPEGWTSAPPSNSMRLAELIVNASDPAARCLAVFSRAGGDVQSNIARWGGQFSSATPTVSSSTIAGHTVHQVELSGTYMDGMPGGALTPRENWMLRGAIIEAPDGLIFIKMTGPAEAMAACADGWKALMDGITAG